MKLSKNLSLSEVIKSNTAIRLGIDNTPTFEHQENLHLIAQKVFQPLRDHFDAPILVSSGYRSEALNKAIGGSATSQHSKGEALDLDNDALVNPSNSDIFYYIFDWLDFDQLIWEKGDANNPDWVHVSYKKSGNRNQVLRYNGKNYYQFEDKR